MFGPTPPQRPPDDCMIAVTAWDMMSGSIDWTALPTICELLGIRDIETLLSQLMAIRDRKTE